MKMIIKCKICGGDISFNPGDTYGTCDHCGSTSTIPKADDEQKLNRYNRANHFRRQSEFDKAIAAYDRILEEDDTDAEAHWGAALSRYGIEYVEDPATGRHVPTCHRVQVESILADGDYLAALKHAPDEESRKLYEQQAKEIAEIQKGILAISANEKPYDVFICYKETDENGQRTRDSALAQEVYYGLTEQGYKVFFSRITLEDKLGQQYEPYIFAALNSAKVMVVIGTRPEHFNAVWVKNEWSRYLHLMKNDRKRLLIPCYRDMDPYDLPDELSSMQSQDMSKIGFMQDLIRGIRKVLSVGQEKIAVPVQPVVQQVVKENSNVTALLERAYLALEDGEFARADDFCEQALNLDAKNVRAYTGKLMVERKVRKPDDLMNQSTPLTESNHYQKAIRFSTEEQKKQLEKWNQTILDRNERNRKVKLRDQCISQIDGAKSIKDCAQIRATLNTINGFEGVEEALRKCDRKEEEINVKNYETALNLMNLKKWDEAIASFQLTQGYRDSKTKIRECEEGKKEGRYQKACIEAKELRFENAIGIFRELGNYKDSQERMKQSIKDKEAKERRAQERKEREEREKAEAAKRAAARKKKVIIGAFIAAVIAVAAFFVVTKVIIPKGHYDQGLRLMAKGQWEEAVAEFAEAGDYSDAETQILEARYLLAKSLYDEKNYSASLSAYQIIKGYKDVENILNSDENLIAAAVAAAREAKLASFKTVGNIVTFGIYEQDNNPSNGKEGIEWLVLDVQDGKVLLLSKYGLDAKPYNTEYTSITWAKCTLRDWLNSDFLETAFSEEEKTAILTTEVDNSASQGYSKWNTDGGNNTQDQIFLLSYTEANKYLKVTNDNSNNLKSRVSPTAYAKARGAYTSDGNKTEDGSAAGWWWLRSPGSFQEFAAYVGRDGSLHSSYVHRDNAVVRPAFWLNLESDIF